MYMIDGCDSVFVLIHPHIGSSRLGYEQVRESCGHPLAVLVEHTKKAIVSSRLTVVIPLLGMTGYLISLIELKS
jgi:hypothetical protein